ncbi:hypothetical protein EDF62_3248 [Leucobacter luti]|uniref:Uncharacterized protein n=1 Tax=Leucobacter luti TaxID=340320 RepID=A0A4R6RT75_9MICO|nr:hypothetical protein [Leucobacter luti]TDP89517.1 hypothetical protein EDF62_3248 [Leucobacter luti]
MATTTDNLRSLMNQATPSIRDGADDHTWEQRLLEQNDNMIERLKSNEPLDIRRGLARGVAVFSIYELLLSARKESGSDVSAVAGGNVNKELELVAA